MSKDVKILRLSTGEDIIATVGENDQGTSLTKSFVIIPQQQGPGKPVQLMMVLYAPYAKSDSVTIDNKFIVSSVEPKKEILDTYLQNTSSILQNPGLITENTIPKIDS